MLEFSKAIAVLGFDKIVVGTATFLAIVASRPFNIKEKLTTSI